MKPTLGRVVFFCLPDGPNKGEERAAHVTRVWGPNCVNLRVELDGTNDTGSSDWVTSVTENTGGAPLEGQWRWPPREG